MIFFSFKKLSSTHSRKISNQKADVEKVKAIRRAIRRAEKFSFWKNKCLVSTLCARRMLNRRGIDSQAFLGMRKTGANLEAHAWLISLDINVVPNTDEHEVLYEF